MADDRPTEPFADEPGDPSGGRSQPDQPSSEHAYEPPDSLTPDADEPSGSGLRPAFGGDAEPSDPEAETSAVEPVTPGPSSAGGSGDLSDAPPKHVGAYRVIGQIGRGGMGSVYSAVREGDRFKRRVAIKVLSDDWTSHSTQARFTAEADTLARAMRDARPATVVHLAAKAGVRPSIEDPIGYARANVAATAAVMETARNAGAERLVIASSSSVYGNNGKTPFSEDDPVEHPISPYAATKRAGELMDME